MSCPVCRMPYVPHPTISANPLPVHFPPQGMLTKQQYDYFNTGMGIGTTIMGVIRKLVYFSGNMFGGHKTKAMVISIVWESCGMTVFIAHVACADLLRRAFNCEELNVTNLVTLCQITEVIGACGIGPNAGRLPYVNYNRVGEKIDLSNFWHDHAPGDEGNNYFDWKALGNSKYSWLVNRPDVFPKFPAKVDANRVPSEDFTIGENDAICNKPMDVLHALVPYLPARSYVMLVSTCRQLRYHALTTLQPHARNIVISLVWPLPTRNEYNSAPKDVRAIMVSEDMAVSPVDADWYMYLSRAHRTKGMRVRRWIWNSCQEIKRVYDERLPTSPFVVTKEGGKSKQRKELEKKVSQMFMMYNV
ncbi:F-box domain-containing protein [Pleurotus pulmonarius]